MHTLLGVFVVSVLYRRHVHEWDTARDKARAEAHRLLDAARRPGSTVTEAEITRALWATGDMVPVPGALAFREPVS